MGGLISLVGYLPGLRRYADELRPMPVDVLCRAIVRILRDGAPTGGKLSQQGNLSDFGPPQKNRSFSHRTGNGLILSDGDWDFVQFKQYVLDHTRTGGAVAPFPWGGSKI